MNNYTQLSQEERAIIADGTPHKSVSDIVK